MKEYEVFYEHEVKGYSFRQKRRLKVSSPNKNEAVKKVITYLIAEDELETKDKFTLHLVKEIKWKCKRSDYPLQSEYTI